MDRDKYLQYQKEYNEKNKQKKKEYYQSPEGKKSSTISRWKGFGIIHSNFDELYDRFLNTTNCELCNVEFTISRYTTKTTRCLDHDHSITDKDNVRNIICHSCNRKVN